MSSMDGRGLGANDWTEMELKKRAYRVIASDSALLQEASTVESGDSTPVAGCSGPVPMVWAPRAARGALMRGVNSNATGVFRSTTRSDLELWGNCG